MITLLPIEDIRTDGGTQPRVQMHQPTIKEYIDDMKNGALFPPLTVFYDGAEYWLADGFHRIEAAHAATIEELEPYLNGEIVVLVLGPSCAADGSLTSAERLLGDHREVGALLVAEELTTTLLQQALRSGVKDVLAGPADDAHLDTIAACGGDRIRWIALTHTHEDHSPGAAGLRARTGAELVGFDRSETLITGLNARGHRFARANVPIRTANHLVQWELCKRGIAICVMMEEVGEAEPLVERVLPELGPPVSFPTWLSCHRELKTSRRIRVVYDLLASRLA